MLRALPTPLIGACSFVALILNTLCCIPVLMLVTAVRICVPWPPLVLACRRAAASIATAWIGFNVAGLKAGGDIRWHVVEPPGLRRDAWYLVISNHRSAVDIVVLQWLFNRRIPLIKFFLKRQLAWVPLLGMAWWALEFPFMRRYPRAMLERRPDLRRKDLETTRRACERFRDLPVTVLNFLEGTRFTDAKCREQQSPYRHLLFPRAGGVAQVVSSIGDRLDALLDVTIVYPDGTPTLWQLVSGQIRRVAVHVEAVRIDPRWVGRSYHDDPEFRESFQAFVRDLWANKDARLDVMLGSGAGAA
jgi:1-acyl-sn-glycerol-3-phosphate acyltransferase